METSYLKKEKPIAPSLSLFSSTNEQHASQRVNRYNLFFLCMGLLVITGLSLANWKSVGKETIDKAPLSFKDLQIEKSFGRQALTKAFPSTSWRRVIKNTLCVFAFVIFYFGLNRVGLGPLRSGLLCLGAMFSNKTLWKFQPVFEADGPGFSFCLMALGFLLCALASPHKKRRYWLLVAVSVFFSVILVSRYISLLISMPLIAYLMGSILGYGRSKIRRLLALTSISMLLPLLLFGILRKLAVGHFGLVSAGGLNSGAFFAQLLTDKMLPSLPSSVQNRAEKAMRMRERIIRHQRVLIKPNFVEMGLEIDKLISPRRDKFLYPVAHNGRLNYEQAFYQHKPTWLLIRWNKKRDENITNIQLNKIWSELNWQILKKQPDLFLDWVTGSFQISIAYLAKRSGSAIIIGLILFAITYVITRVGRLRKGSRIKRELLILGIAVGIPLLFIIPNLMVICIFGRPIPRYLFPHTTLLGLIPMTLIVLSIEQIFQRLHLPYIYRNRV